MKEVKWLICEKRTFISLHANLVIYRSEFGFKYVMEFSNGFEVIYFTDLEKEMKFDTERQLLSTVFKLWYAISKVDRTIKTGFGTLLPAELIQLSYQYDIDPI